MFLPDHGVVTPVSCYQLDQGEPHLKARVMTPHTDWLFSSLFPETFTGWPFTLGPQRGMDDLFGGGMPSQLELRTTVPETCLILHLYQVMC